MFIKSEIQQLWNQSLNFQLETYFSYKLLKDFTNKVSLQHSPSSHSSPQVLVSISKLLLKSMASFSLFCFFYMCVCVHVCKTFAVNKLTKLIGSQEYGGLGLICSLNI